MERLFFKRIPFWLVLLIMLFSVVGAILFGAMVKSVAQDPDSLGFVGRIAYRIASVPDTAKELLSPQPISRMNVEQSGRFAGHKGWTFNRSDPAALPTGYLLFSRYDGDIDHAVIELIDLHLGKTVNRLVIDADKLLEGAPRDSKVVHFMNWSTARFRAISPLPLENGDLIIRDHGTPLWRINACGEQVWRQEGDLFHHSTERGLDRTIWVPSFMEPTKIKGLGPRYHDDSIAQLSPDGKILYERSLTDVMLKAGLGHLLFANELFDPDPLHINDIQPVLADGPYWKAGDVLLSLRHKSMVILFRPSTDKIVWMKQGPWSGQHDVDIIDDHTIGVFNNNIQNRGRGEVVQGNSEITYYDFATGKTSNPFHSIFKANDIHTETEGQFTVLPSGHLLVEESDGGRTLIFSPSGKLVAENVNRGKDGYVYNLGWSRYLDREEGDKILVAMKNQRCHHRVA